jgi:CRISPR-associated endonuclease Csn1
MRRVFRLLQEWGLLPAGEADTPQKRQNLLTQLDREILSSEWFRNRETDAAIPEAAQVLPYLLRAAALDERLEPHFFGRALYHLAQRRGFVSNRRELATGGKEEEEGKVRPAISELRQEMAEAGARTLGEYLARLNPFEKRIRARWTARDMYEDEFGKIWEAQQGYHPGVVTPERRKELERAIFYQRPLRFPRNLVGECELEPGQRHAPMHLLVSQRFRLLQKANDLRVQAPGEIERDLTESERRGLLESLEAKRDLTFSEMRKLLGLKKGVKFNLETAGETKIPGNRTGSQFREVFGEQWERMTPAERDAAVEYVWSFEKPGKLAAAAVRKWGLEEAVAERLSEITLEPGHMNLSRRAMLRLLPLMEKGMGYAEARRKLYPEKWEAKEPCKLLPPVFQSEETIGRIRNPAVIRALTELRKVVNAIVRAYGKPWEIRIELARDLRNSRKQREAMAEANRENEKLREQAKRLIREETGDAHPSRRDITKVLLAKECRWECPYTGKPIGMRALVGPEPQFDIEHILPFSRSLDNSFANLTLCEIEHNRNVKQRRAPAEAYGADPETYQAIVQRVRQFTSRYAREKLRRFLMTEEEIGEFVSDFAERQLNDTRYAARVAADYLGLLYGGRVDAEKKLRVRCTAGRLTSILRDEWKLNAVLNDGPTSAGGEKPKSRDDHRHHAVDAIVTALTDDGTIAMLNRAAERAPLEGRRRFACIEAPWPEFVDSVREEIGRIIVSHRVSKRVRGPLHKETIYSAPIPVPSRSKRKRGESGLGVEHRVRKPLSVISRKDVAEIADPVIQRLVQEKLDELGEPEPKKAFSNEANQPHLSARDGRKIPIKRVRVREAVPVMTLGSGRTARHVTPEANHHAEIFAELDSAGREIKWGAKVVPLAEAVRRKREGRPIVERDHGANREFKFSLAPGEVIEVDGEQDRERRLLVVRGCTQLSAGAVQIFLTPISDARKKEAQVKDGAYLRLAPNTLRGRGARKVGVTPLGDIVETHE